MKQYYVDQVRAGTKTSTIRLWPRCALRPGGPISFNGRTRAHCTSIDRVRLANLSDPDIRADGFASRTHFRTAFLSHYPTATDDSLVWVIRFALNDSAHIARATDRSHGNPTY